MKPLKINNILITEYELEESIECLFIEFQMDIDKQAIHYEVNSELGKYIYMFDRYYDSEGITYLEIANYKEAIKNEFSDLPFNFFVEYNSNKMLLRDFVSIYSKELV